ncbi:MAG: ExsB family protein, partial [Armatimonadota bacterium]|nr:ExsB family protein [Armatimonadota bacterium]
CTRTIKLGMVKAASRGRLVLTGSNRSDTWGQMGVKVANGFYAPLLDLDKPQIRGLADELGLRIPRIGEHPGREGCKLKHLLKPLVSPTYHGRAVAEANEVLLEVLSSHGVRADLANVKIIGPLSRNVALVNVRPHPPAEVREAIRAALVRLPVLDEVRFVDGPQRLVVMAGPALAGDAAGRGWVARGRLAVDFAHPIEVEWRPSQNPRLRTFQVVDAVPAGTPT